jgi:L-alanine-DL-glutamate epimerase-like enolase superfamily enzyme
MSRPDPEGARGELPRDIVDDCRIEAVEPVILAAPVEPGLESWQRGWTKSVLVRVRARCGAEGYGLSESQPEVIRAIIEAPPQDSFSEDVLATLGGLRALVLGQSAANIAPLWARMYEGTFLYGRRGAAIQAMSAIEIACTDLLSRYLGISVSHLLGGRFRESVRAYASSVFPDAASELRSLAEYVSDGGFTALKLGWGAFCQETPEITSRIDDLRSRLPKSVRLIFDIGCERRRTAKEIVQLVRSLEDYDPLWIEEPCHPDDIESYRTVAREVSVPIAAGEACTALDEFDQLINAGVTVIQPDLSRCGGFLAAQQVAARAASANCLTVPHAWQNDLLVAATTHFCAMLPREPLVEFSVASTRLRAICDAAAPVDGVVPVPNGPGLGLVPNLELIERLRVA